MSADDKLPSKICTDCKKQIVTFYTFKQKTKRTEESLLSMFAPEANIITEAAHCAMCNLIFENGDAYIEHVQNEHHDANIYELENESAKMIRANIKEQEFEIYNIEENSDETEIFTDEQDMLATEDELKVEPTRTLRSRKGASKSTEVIPSNDAKPKRNAKPTNEKPTTSKVVYKTEISDIDENMDTNDSNYEYQTGSESLECPYECPLCGTQFSEYDEYVQHCKEHDDFQYQCDSCNDFFINEDQYCQHECEVIDKNENENEEDLICVPCNKRMKSTAQLRQHKKMHDSMSLIIDSMDFYPCHECCLLFISKEKLNEHNASEHTEKIGKDPSDLSEKIDDSCTDYQFLDGELQTEYKEGEKYECGECNQLSFQTITELKYHVILHATKFQCPIDECGCQYDQMSRLSIHVLNKHINSKNLQCLHCSQPFETYDDLQAHLKNSCKEKKFNCHECGMCFFHLI